MSSAHTDRYGRITLNFDTLDEYREFIAEVRSTTPNREENRHGSTNPVPRVRERVAYH